MDPTPHPIDLSKPGPLLTPDDLVTILALPSRKSLEMMLARGHAPPSFQLGQSRVRRWTREAVRTWIQERERAGGAS